MGILQICYSTLRFSILLLHTLLYCTPLVPRIRCERSCTSRPTVPHETATTEHEAAVTRHETTTGPNSPRRNPVLTPPSTRQKSPFCAVLGATHQTNPCNLHPVAAPTLRIGTTDPTGIAPTEHAPTACILVHRAVIAASLHHSCGTYSTRVEAGPPEIDTARVLCNAGS